jgi:hypothetical protein
MIHVDFLLIQRVFSQGRPTDEIGSVAEIPSVLQAIAVFAVLFGGGVHAVA